MSAASPGPKVGSAWRGRCVVCQGSGNQTMKPMGLMPTIWQPSNEAEEDSGHSERDLEVCGFVDYAVWRERVELGGARAARGRRREGRGIRRWGFKMHSLSVSLALRGAVVFVSIANLGKLAGYFLRMCSSTCWRRPGNLLPGAAGRGAVSQPGAGR
jgi:hypothetical protein